MRTYTNRLCGFFVKGFLGEHFVRGNCVCDFWGQTFLNID